MEPSELRDNLTIGSSSPRDDRSQGDLGRFAWFKDRLFLSHSIYCVFQNSTVVVGHRGDLEHVTRMSGRHGI